MVQKKNSDDCRSCLLLSGLLFKIAKHNAEQILESFPFSLFPIALLFFVSSTRSDAEALKQRPSFAAKNVLTATSVQRPMLPTTMMTKRYVTSETLKVRAMANRGLLCSSHLNVENMNN